MRPVDREEAFRGLEAIYEDLQTELEALGPECRQSGRCCRFAEYGHQLWVTRLEFEYLLAGAGMPDRVPEGACPYLEDGLCGARRRRLLACRTFFCQPSFKLHMGALHEKYHRRTRDLHARAGLAYEYFEFLDAWIRRKAAPAV